jgi:hypothetical protein
MDYFPGSDISQYGQEAVQRWIGNQHNVSITDLAAAVARSDKNLLRDVIHKFAPDRKGLDDFLLEITGGRIRPHIRNKAMINACRLGNDDAVKRLLKEGFRVSMQLINAAQRYKRDDLFKFLMGKIDATHPQTFIDACRDGPKEMVEYLLQTKKCPKEALFVAIVCGDPDILTLLIDGKLYFSGN